MSFLGRDTPFGQVIRFLSGNNHLFLYPEERPDFQVPDSLVDKSEKRGDEESNEEKPLSDDNKDTIKKNLVDWYSPTDPENPKNWSTSKKCLAFAQICLCTFTALCGSSITAPAEGIFMQKFGVSSQVSGLVLSMYVLGCGCGPLLFSPLSEVPRIGRNIPYMVGLTLGLIMTIPAAVVKNYAGLVITRFLQGFFIGPTIATSGASAGDLFGFNKVTYAMCAWTVAAYAGPALGPLLSGFAVSATWRWTMYELLMLNGISLIVMFFFMPETNAQTLLLKRAQRLRKLTGNQELCSASEIKQRDIHIFRLMLSYLTIPFKVTVQDPAVAFVHGYTATVYAIYFSFFESFPLVYIDTYHMSLGIMGVVFISIVIASILAAMVYTILLWKIYEPYTLKNGIGNPEYRLVPAIAAASFIPIGLFLFAWTSRVNINWAVPTLGILFFGSGAFILLQCIVVYLPTSYPMYAASLFAMNTFLRNAFAAGAVHYARPLFSNLGVDRGCSLLGGVSFGFFLGMLTLYLYGGRLRAKSKFAARY